MNLRSFPQYLFLFLALALTACLPASHKELRPTPLPNLNFTLKPIISPFETGGTAGFKLEPEDTQLIISKPIKAESFLTTPDGTVYRTEILLKNEVLQTPCSPNEGGFCDENKIVQPFDIYVSFNEQMQQTGTYTVSLKAVGKDTQ